MDEARQFRSSITATAASSAETRLRPSASMTGWSPPIRNWPVALAGG
jgi:hypothetical protein